MYTSSMSRPSDVGCQLHFGNGVGDAEGDVAGLMEIGSVGENGAGEIHTADSGPECRQSHCMIFLKKVHIEWVVGLFELFPGFALGSQGFIAGLNKRD